MVRKNLKMESSLFFQFQTLKKVKISEKDELTEFDEKEKFHENQNRQNC